MDRATLLTLDRETLVELVLHLVAEQATVITALQQQVAAVQQENAELRVRLGQNSSNSSRPPSSDLPGARPAAKRPPSGRRAGGQPGHPGHQRTLLPVGEVDRVIPLVPAVCRQCGEVLPATAGPGDPADERQQVTELPPPRAEVTEYQLAARRCGGCGTVTRASRPAEAGASAFGPRLQAVVALLSGRYRLSRREVVQLMSDVWGAEVALGSVVELEQATSAALAPVVAEAHTMAQHANVANVDETGWREGRRKAWLWVMVTALLTVFRVDRTRSGQVARELLGPTWRGLVGSDRFSGYAWLEVPWRQICWAHLKRDFQQLVDWGGAAAVLSGANGSGRQRSRSKARFSSCGTGSGPGRSTGRRCRRSWTRCGWNCVICCWLGPPASTPRRPGAAPSCCGSGRRSGASPATRGWSRPTTRRSRPCGQQSCGGKAASARTVRLAVASPSACSPSARPVGSRGVTCSACSSPPIRPPASGRSRPRSSPPATGRLNAYERT